MILNLEVSFERYKKSLKGNKLNELMNSIFYESVTFKYPTILNERSGYFSLMANLLQKNMFFHLKQDIKKINENNYNVTENGLYYKGKLILTRVEREDGDYTIVVFSTK